MSDRSVHAKAPAGTRPIRLGELKKGQRAFVVQVNPHNKFDSSRLSEMGFIPGSWVEIIHEAPFGRDPLAVRVRGTLVALRRSEANAVEVILGEASASSPSPEQIAPVSAPMNAPVGTKEK